jgi:hypothetical protein
MTTRARSAVSARNDLTPRRAASSRLAAHARREGRAHTQPHVGGAFGVGLGEWPARPALFCRRLDGSAATVNGNVSAVILVV